MSSAVSPPRLRGISDPGFAQGPSIGTGESQRVDVEMVAAGSVDATGISVTTVAVQAQKGEASNLGASLPNQSSEPEVKRTYANVVNKKSFTKQEVVISEFDGKQRVVVPKDVFVDAKPLWEDFVIGKFLSSKAPHVGKIHMIVNKIWRLGDKSTLIDVYEVNDTTVKFRIRNEVMRQRIVNRGMWNLMDIPMIVSKWTPFAEEEQPAMKSIPLWVTLTNVPPTMYTEKGLEFLFSAVGKPIRLHPRTVACMNFEEAQMFVEADLTKELPREYLLTGEEEGEMNVEVQYSYPWLPPRCSNCQKWGHVRDVCIVKTTTISQNQEIVTNDIVSKQNEEPAIVETPINSQNETVATSLQGEKPKESEGNAWITPQRISRSPGKTKEALKYGEVSILSNSYSVLSGQGDAEEQEVGNQTEHDEVCEVVIGETLGDGVSDTIRETVQEVVTEVEGVEEMNFAQPMLDVELPEAALSEETKPNNASVESGRGLPPRDPLPRASKAGHRVVPKLSSQTPRNSSRNQNRKNSSHPL